MGLTRPGPVAAAALILAGTFASLMISGVPFFVEIGFAVTLGIVLVALVVSILLVPAVTALVGRAAWWPGTRPGTATTRERSELDEPTLTARS
jgi:RND superfamily putative drug exporter